MRVHAAGPLFIFFNDTATTEIYTLSLHDALPICTIEVRAMRAHGYDPGFAVGITAASSMLGPLLPPSLPLVIFGVSANASIGQLFAAGIIPGLILATCLMGMVWFYARVRGYGTDAK